MELLFLLELQRAGIVVGHYRYIYIHRYKYIVVYVCLDKCGTPRDTRIKFLSAAIVFFFIEHKEGLLRRCRIVWIGLHAHLSPPSPYACKLLLQYLYNPCNDVGWSTDHKPVREFFLFLSHTFFISSDNMVSSFIDKIVHYLVLSKQHERSMPSSHNIWQRHILFNVNQNVGNIKFSLQNKHFYKHAYLLTKRTRYINNVK